MNHDATHCADFCSDCPMKCYRAELEVDLRSRWKEFIGVPLSYAHLYGTEKCKRDSYHKESEVKVGRCRATGKRARGMIERYRVSEYTDFSLGDGLPYCRWVVREGNGTRYWAMTTCKRGFNPLTKVRHVGEIKKVYDGCYCPICGRPIKTSGYVFDDDFEESEVAE